MFRLSNGELSFIRIQSAAGAALCCSTADLAAAALPLVRAAVRRRVPDGHICCWFIETDLSVFFLFIQTRSNFYVSLRKSTVSHLQPRLVYILGNYGHAQSQGGRQPAVAKFPSMCLTSLVSPDPAGGGLSRTHVISRRRVLLSSFCQISQLYTILEYCG